MNRASLTGFPSDRSRTAPAELASKRGYADTSMTADEIIGNYRGWLYRAASMLTGYSDADLEDLVQEGRIAMWQALATYDESKGALPAWLTQKARGRMFKIAFQDRPWTGQPSRRDGRHGVEHPEVLSLDAERAEGASLADTIAAPACARSDLPERQGAELSAALAQLPQIQRQAVDTLFWQDATGREKMAASARWRFIKPKLLAALARLGKREGVSWPG